MPRSTALRGLLCLGLLLGAGSAPAVAGLGRALFARPSPVSQSRMARGDWRLTIETDRFSGQKRCHLAEHHRRVIYAAGALGFSFAAHADTAGAWFKIDDAAPPSRWQDELPALTRLGAPMEATALDTPSDGIVWVPASRLDGANHIAIQPGDRQRATIFPLQGFASLRDIAHQMGCTPEQRFVR